MTLLKFNITCSHQDFFKFPKIFYINLCRLTNSFQNQQNKNHINFLFLPLLFSTRYPIILLLNQTTISHYSFQVQFFFPFYQYEDFDFLKIIRLREGELYSKGTIIEMG